MVGVEKDNRSRVGLLAECAGPVPGPACLAIDAPYFTERPTLRANLRGKYQGQWRPMYVSHIARFDGNAVLPCFLVNRLRSALPCAEALSAAASADKAVAASWPALAVLGSDLQRRIALSRPSHVIVYTMGWNTEQLEAMDNFRDLAGQLAAAAREAGDTAFKPLVIGVTWPSTGRPTVPGSDYGIKAKDADEVGAIWLNLLINRELRRLKAAGGFKLVVVGHSFGARATSRAVFSAPLVSSDMAPLVDLLIGLQGAYSFQRYLGAEDGDAPEGVEGAPYHQHATQAGLVALTSSRHDSAVTAARHARFFVGSNAVFQRTQDEAYAADFSHASTDDSGRLPSTPACDPRRVLMIDASSVITGNKPGTGGGAHSMIYTPAIGRLTHQLLRACAP